MITVEETLEAKKGKKSQACKKRDRQRMMQFIARKKLEESETKKKKKYQRKAESFQGVEDEISLY